MKVHPHDCFSSPDGDVARRDLACGVAARKCHLAEGDVGGNLVCVGGGGGGGGGDKEEDEEDEVIAAERVSIREGKDDERKEVHAGVGCEARRHPLLAGLGSATRAGLARLLEMLHGGGGGGGGGRSQSGAGHQAHAFPPNPRETCDGVAEKISNVEVIDFRLNFNFREK